MATNTAGDTGRDLHTQQTHYFRKRITYEDDGVELVVGYLPPGAVIINAGVVVTTAFNSTSTEVLDIGIKTDDVDDFATDLLLGTKGRIVADEMATADNLYSASAKTVVCQVTLGSAATAGEGFVYVEFMPDNDL